MDERMTPTPVAEIVELTSELIRSPSQGGIDEPQGVLSIIESWLSENGVPYRAVESRGSVLGILATLDSGKPGPCVCLDAPVDTAPAGRLDGWTYPPFSPMLVDSRLYGRGAADCKVGAAMFCHLIREMDSEAEIRRGKLHVLLEADEHTGNFGCIKSLVDDGFPLDFVAIGYPGNYGVVTGARGFLRLRVRVFGTNAHSGSKRSRSSQSALLKGSRLVIDLHSLDLPEEPDLDFDFGPSLNVTEMQSGSGFSQIPGEAIINIDIRITPGFDKLMAEKLVRSTIAGLDRRFPTAEATEIFEVDTWPSYKLDADDRYSAVLRQSAEEFLGRPVPAVICGPSNIGNLLASYGIKATCGFGVTYKNVHAADEYIDIETIDPIYRSYRSAVRKWLC